MTVNPSFGKQRQEDGSEFKASLGYLVSPGQPELQSKTPSQRKKKSEYDVSSVEASLSLNKAR